MERNMPFEFSEVVEDSLEEFVYEGSSFYFSKQEELDIEDYLSFYNDQAIVFID
jgi:hypothetical protein